MPLTKTEITYAAAWIHSTTIREIPKISVNLKDFMGLPFRK